MHTGRQCISTEETAVEVKIIDEYHRSGYVTPMRAGKITTMISHPAVYRITVEYNGAEYCLNGSEIYNTFADKVGACVIGTLKIRKYDDGTVKYDIISLKEQGDE